VPGSLSVDMLHSVGVKRKKMNKGARSYVN
jgi:hypothetical protein